MVLIKEQRDLKMGNPNPIPNPNPNPNPNRYCRNSAVFLYIKYFLLLLTHFVLQYLHNSIFYNVILWSIFPILNIKNHIHQKEEKLTKMIPFTKKNGNCNTRKRPSA